MKNPIIGELIRGKKEADNEYFITNSQMTLAEIIEVYNPKSIRIKIIQHPDIFVINRTYKVNSKFFKRIKSKT